MTTTAEGEEARREEKRGHWGWGSKRQNGAGGDVLVALPVMSDLPRSALSKSMRDG